MSLIFLLTESVPVKSLARFSLPKKNTSKFPGVMLANGAALALAPEVVICACAAHFIQLELGMCAHVQHHVAYTTSDKELESI